MATRPLTPLTMCGWGMSPASKSYVWEKTTNNGSGRVRYDYGYDRQVFNEQEVRDLHTWLGKVVEDLDAGV